MLIITLFSIHLYYSHGKYFHELYGSIAVKINGKSAGSDEKQAQLSDKLKKQEGNISIDNCTKLSLDTNLHFSKAKCTNLKNLINSFYKSKNSAPEFYKITGAFHFKNYGWLLTVDTGYLFLLSENLDSVIHVTNLQPPNFKWASFGGLISSFFISPTKGYIYYTSESNGSLGLILEEISLHNGKIIHRASYPIAFGDFQISALGGGMAIHDNYLYLAVGHGSEDFDSKYADKSQDISSPFGKVLKIDLSRLRENEPLPYSLFTLGNKNPQGMKFIDGYLFEVEHGPDGGDEINILKNGGNYGWNKWSYGAYLSHRKNMDVFDAEFIDPIYYFSPSIAISDIASCPFISQKDYSYTPCIVVSSLRGGSFFIVKFKREGAGNQIASLKSNSNPSVLSVEKIEVGERIRRVVTEPNTLVLFTDILNIYKIKFERKI